MIRDILRMGDPRLLRVSRPVERFDTAELDALVTDLMDTMQAANGAGLAAPQIGLPVALAVVEDPLADPSREREPVPFRVLVNPRYEAVGGELPAFEEGCLSVPGYAAVVARHRRVRLVGQDEQGTALDEELVGWPARIVQHETDHLGGTLYIDKADLRTLAAV